MPKKLILSGRVQGVGCRQYCSSYAHELNINGSATNKADGTVEVLLNTDNLQVVETFRKALLSNPKGYLFFGRIQDIRINDYNGQFSGDYNF